MRGDTIRANFGAGRFFNTTEAWQWDYGLELEISGLTLPNVFEVHFSNQATAGTTTTQIGQDNRVIIPDAYLTTGENVFAFIYLHEGESDGETEYKIMIPVKQRPKPTNATPTPVQQDAITEAIAALNQAVEQADEAIEHYPKIEDGTWWVWDVDSGAYVDTQVSAEGQQGAPGQDGAPGHDGKDGKDGQDGEDGISPTVTVTDITGGHRVTIADAEGSQSFDVLNGENGQNGQNGADGFSPTASVSKSGSTATITITDKNGTTTASVSDGTDGQNGQDGAPGVGVPSGGTIGQILQKKSGTDYDTEWTDKPTVASAAEVKGGSVSSAFIAPSVEDAASFYGLAKAAGDTSQSASSNAVGTYTDDAKVKIQKMLGIYEAPWELIREDTFTNATEDEYSVTVDGDGNAFELTDIIFCFEAPKQDTASAMGSYGQVWVYYNAYDYIQVPTGAYTQAANGDSHGFYILVSKNDSLIKTEFTTSVTNFNQSQTRLAYQEGFTGKQQGVLMISNFSVVKIKIKAFTGTGHYKLYGKRKWS